MSQPSSAFPPGTLGIDFGTSNSAAAWAAAGGRARLLALEGEATALPTAVFFHAEERSVHFGREAVALYLSGAEGRLMRSLKSLLGSSLLLEKTAVNGEAMSFQDIIATFLAELRRRAATVIGHTPSSAVLGRPVHFVDDDAQRDRLAESMLQEAARRAGFQEVAFELEPIAAALDYETRIEREQLVLVADIGGGTSDFTVVRLGPERMKRADRREDVLATTGVHVGGTDFDRRLNLASVMPLLGLNHIGPQGREVPSPVFFDLATWHLIHWRYTPQALREARELRSAYSDLALHARLLRVLEGRHGHRVADAVERAKIASSSSGAPGRIDLGVAEAGLAAAFDALQMHTWLQELLGKVVECALECVQRAGIAPQQLGTVYLTGGSSALVPLRRALQAALPGAEQVEGDLFGGVASGLAYAARSR